MTFNIKNFSPTGGQSARGSAPQSFQYITTDNKLTVANSGYFNEARTVLEVSDLITVVDESSVTTYKVTSKPLQGDLEIEKSEFSTSIEVNSEEDLGEVGETTITLRSDISKYRINKSFSLTKDLIIPTGAIIEFEAEDIFSIQISFTGSTFLTGDGITAIAFRNLTIFGNNGVLHDLDNGGVVLYEKCQLGFWSDAGTLRGSNLLLLDSDCAFLTSEGFKFRQRTDLATTPRSNIRLDGAFFGNNSIPLLFDIADPNMLRMVFSNGGHSPTNTETVFRFDKNVLQTDANIVITSFNLFSDPLQTFDNDSLDQTFTNAVVDTSLRIASSTALVKLRFQGNTIASVSGGAGVDNAILTNAFYQEQSFDERFVRQDIITFDSSTNTLTANFSHQMSDGDKVTLTPTEYDGVLPSELDGNTEYFVLNASGPDFKVSLSEGGSEVAFGDNGSGINYFRHSTGVSELGEVIYIGNESVKCAIGGHMAISSSTTTLVDVRASLNKIATDNTRTLIEDGSVVPANIAILNSSDIDDIVEFKNGEGFVPTVRNETNGNNLTVEESLIIISRS